MGGLPGAGANRVYLTGDLLPVSKGSSEFKLRFLERYLDLEKILADLGFSARVYFLL